MRTAAALLACFCAVALVPGTTGQKTTYAAEKAICGKAFTWKWAVTKEYKARLPKEQKKAERLSARKTAKTAWKKAKRKACKKAARIVTRIKAKRNGCVCTGNKGASDGTKFLKDIGETCAPQDGNEPYCKAGGSSFGSDWCSHDWCYVDPLTCDKPVYKSSYFPGTELYFSYMACNATFAGNTWVGFCECTGNQGASDGTKFLKTMGGAATGLKDVRGCQPHDGMEPYCKAGGSSAGSDWCEDDWCYVNKSRCDKPTYVSSYFAAGKAGTTAGWSGSLSFSYSACNATFTGNTWVGLGPNKRRLEEADEEGSSVAWLRGRLGDLWGSLAGMAS